MCLIMKVNGWYEEIDSGKLFYLNKRRDYKRSKAFELLKEAIQLENGSRALKEKQDAANHFLYNAYRVGIEFYC